MTTVKFGRALRKDFLFDPNYIPLNHGSYGTVPRIVQQKVHEYEALCESFPDKFNRIEMYPLLKQSRELLANVIHCDPDNLIFASNASNAANTILRSYPFEEGDKVLCFDTAYANVNSTFEFIKNYKKVELVRITLNYPLNDAEIVDLVKEAIETEKVKGKPIRMAVIDVLSSLPGVLFPYKTLNQLCKENDIVTVLDGAHAVGQIPINLDEIQPDFFFSNVHKWFFVKRGHAILYVSKNQKGFVHPSTINVNYVHHENANDASSFEAEFASPGTIDHATYLTIPEVIKYRESLGGEEAIMKYNHDLAVRGGALVAEILGTQVLENDDKTLTACMVNVELPLKTTLADNEIGKTIVRKLIYEHNTMASPFKNNGKWWIRLCGQVYLELDDFKKGGEAILKVCQDLNNL
ncbi:unnamed protein product [Cunninghamella blakesleeana]